MKKFLRKIILSIILFTLLSGGILIFIFSIDTTKSTDYLKAYSDKKAKLVEIKNNHKIIFIGGSNVAFGLNSEEIKKNFSEYEILNYGLHAGIGMKYLLNEIEEYLKVGDILIIIPEYQHFYNGGLGDDTLWKIVGIQKSLKSLDWDYLKKLDKLFLSFINFININDKNEDYGKKFTYDRRGFNKYGDYTEHWKFEKKDKISPTIIQETKLSKKFMEEFKFKIKKIKDCGIKVYLFPPVYRESAYHLNKDKILLIESKLGSFDIKPADFIYSDNLFFDTDYHLNKEGVDKRTYQIIQHLKKESK